MPIRHGGILAKRALDLATRPFLTQHNRATLIVAHDVERVLADIDTNHGNCSVECLGHGVLLVLVPLASLSLAGRAQGRARPITASARLSLLPLPTPIFATFSL